MVGGQGHEATGRAFALISRRILAMSPQTTRQSLIFAELLKSLDSISGFRAARLDSLSARLPRIYWVVILFTVATLLFVSSILAQTRFRTIGLACQMAVA